MEKIPDQTICANNIAQSEEDCNIKIKALEKLNNEAELCSGQNVPAIAIYHYIQDQINASEEYARKVMIDTKHLHKCFSYITEIAYTRAKADWEAQGSPRNQASMVGMDSTEIFALVDDYFSLDDEAIEAKKQAEKEAAEKKKEAARQKREAEAKAKKPDKKKPKAEKDKEKSGDSGQMSLFSEVSEDDSI